MIEWMILIIAAGSFLYGMYLLIAGRPLRRERNSPLLRQIAERYHPLYARITGAALLVESAILGGLWYLCHCRQIRQVTPILILLALLLALAAALKAAEMALKKKSKE